MATDGIILPPPQKGKSFAQQIRKYFERWNPLQWIGAILFLLVVVSLGLTALGYGDILPIFLTDKPSLLFFGAVAFALFSLGVENLPDPPNPDKPPVVSREEFESKIGVLRTQGENNRQCISELQAENLLLKGQVDFLRASVAPRELKLVSDALCGEDVREVQRRLIEAGCLVRQSPSGIFDASTSKAVEQFQSDHGLKVDGIVGPKTRKQLGLGNISSGDLQTTPTTIAKSGNRKG